MSGRPRTGVASATFVALVIAALCRLAWALVVPMAPVSDSAIYDGAARRLAQGLPYTIDAASSTPSAHWPVGTAFMYSLVYRVCDPAQCGYLPVVALNFIIGMAVVVLTVRLARRWFGDSAAVWSGLALSVWPMHVEFTTVIASEPVFTACMLGGLLCMWPSRATSEPAAEHGSHAFGGIWRLVLAGLCFAAATYTRPTSLLIPPLIGAVLVVRERRLVCSASQAAIVTVSMIAAILPWSIRNYGVFHTFVLVSTNGGSNMWMGNNPDTTGYYQQIPSPDPGFNEATWDRELGNRAKAYIRQEPAKFVKRSAIKAFRLHDRETIGVAWNKDGLARVSNQFDPKDGVGTKLLKAASSGYWYFMLLAAAAGCAVLARRDGVWRLITHPAIVLFAYFTGVHAIMVIQDRYHFPITPMVACMAGVAVASLIRRKEGAP